MIEAWHRHHDPIRQCKFAVGAFVGDGLRGVAVVEWPKAAALGERDRERAALRRHDEGNKENIG